MARRSYKKFRRYYKKNHWSPNILALADTTLQAAQGSFSATSTLCTNPAVSSTSISQPFTAKNFELNFTLEAASGAETLEGITAYIMFVPQGMNVNESYHTQHPEYILAYKYIGSPSVNQSTSETQQFQPTRIKSRLSRRLQTGDSIILYVQGYNSGSSGTQIMRLSGVIRYWTHAN